MQSFVFLVLAILAPLIIFAQDFTTQETTQGEGQVESDHDRSNDLNVTVIKGDHDQEINWKNLVVEALDNSSKSNGLNELDEWEAPYEIRKNFPYYLSGQDDEGRPIWVAEIGRWNVRAIAERGEAAQNLVLRYAAQAGQRIIKSITTSGTSDEPVVNALVILDLEDFSLAKIAHIPTIALLLRLLRTFLDLIDQYLYQAFVVNTNAAAQALVAVARPVVGKVFERAFVYGTNKAHYFPQILKYCPKNQIAPWYGGSKQFKPVKVYG